MNRITTSLAALGMLTGLAGCVGAPAGPGYAGPSYAAPPLTYTPPRQDVALGATCYAGNYTCPLAEALPAGSQCSCPGLGAPSYGYVR